MSATILKFPSMEERHTAAEQERIMVMLEVLDSMRELVLAGELREFVACSADKFDEYSIHLCSEDFLSGIGLFEVGKSILISMES